MFVVNRVSEIQTTLPDVHWHHMSLEQYRKLRLVDFYPENTRPIPCGKHLYGWSMTTARKYTDAMRNY